MTTPNPQLATWIDQVADQFESAWRTGTAPAISDFATGIEQGEQTALIIELVKIDFEYRWRHGIPCQLEGYFEEYPELRDADESLREDLILHTRRVVQRTATQSTSGQSQETMQLNNPEGFDKEGTDWRPMAMGKFHLTDFLGSGAYGKVYKGRDVELGRTVAIKVPRSIYFATEEDEARFLGEARSAAKLRHPNIVPVYEIGRQGDMPYIVSGFIDAETLADVMTDRHLTDSESAWLIEQLARALDYAHEQKIVHRDVKPTNILIDKSGKPYVADFGLARFDLEDTGLTLDGQVLGTPSYMSPEQAQGQSASADRRTDVYSLGVILYELLTDDRPFRGTTQMVLRQVLEVEPRAPRLLNDRIPRDLETICLKAMSKKREGRYPTAGEMAADLHRFANGEPIRARPVGKTERLWRWARRNPWIASLTSAVVLLLLVLGIGVSWSAVTINNAATQLENHLARSKAAQGVMRLEQGDTGGLLDLLMAYNATDDAQERNNVALVTKGWLHATEGLLHKVVGHDAPLLDATLSHNGSLIATVDPSETIRVWDFKTGMMLMELKHPRPLHDLNRQLRFSSDDTRIFVVNRHTKASVWNISSGEVVDFEGGGGALDPQGRWLATFQNGKIVFWDIQTKKQVMIPLPQNHDVFAFSPDGRFFAAGGEGRYDAEKNNKVSYSRLYQTNDWKQIAEIKHYHRVHAICFSPDSTKLATGSWDDTANIVSTATGQLIAGPLQHDEDVRDVTFNHDGTHLASASMDGTARIWDVETANEKHKFKPGEPVDIVSFSPDGTTLAAAVRDQTARLWDVETGKERSWAFRHQGQITSIEFCCDGKYLLTSSKDQTARFWNLSQTRTEHTLPHTDRVWSVDFSPDSQRLVTTSEEGRVWLWHLNDGKWELERRVRCKQQTLCAVFSPEGEQIIVGDGGELRSWDITSESLISLDLPSLDVYRSVAVDPTGRFVAGGQTGQHVVLFDRTAESFRVLFHRPQIHNAHIWDVEFTQDGKLLGTAYQDGSVRIWDTATGKQLSDGIVHTGGAVESLAFRDNGQWIVTAANDQTVRLWKRTGDQWVFERSVLRQPMTVGAMQVTHDGQILLTGTDGGEVRLWQIDTGLACGPFYDANQQALSVQVSPDRQWLAAGALDNNARIWPVPQLTSKMNAEQIARSVFVTLGARPVKNHGEMAVPYDEWNDLRRALNEENSKPTRD